jgi:transmembrane sensor
MRRDPLERMSASYGDDAIVATASEWLVRLSSRAHAPREQAAFEAWLAIDSRHGDAYDAVSRTWEDVGKLKHLRALADPDPALPVWVRWARAFGRTLARPAPIVGGLVAAGAAAVTFFALTPALDRPDAPLETKIAHARPLRLPDDSVVTLDAAAEIDVRFTEKERRVSLTSGEAFFEVTRNERRPFFVEVGEAVVRVVGTKFDVRRGDGHLGVSVLEGVVQVSISENACAMRVLRAGERAEFEQRAPSEVQAVHISSAGACRDGRLSYDNAPLGDLVADLNRYYAPGVSLSSSAKNLRVTTSFRTDEIPVFLDALSAVLPVEVKRRRDRSFAIGVSRSDAAACDTPARGC